MVLPYDIQEAADEANLAVVEAYLDEAGPGAVNETDEYGTTLLRSSLTNRIEERHVQFARRLIARGADVNIAGREGGAALHLACYPGDCASAMVSLLLQAGARVNVRSREGETTPLGTLIKQFNYCLGPSWSMEGEEEAYDEAAHQRQVSRSGLDIMKLLLRAGASLDRCERDLSAEAAMQAFLSRHPSYANDEYFTKCRELVAGVRAHGSYKAYAREPHRKFLRLRSLLVRGRVKVRGRTKDSRRLERIARLPNGACWHVLSFWREAG